MRAIVRESEEDDDVGGFAVTIEGAPVYDGRRLYEDDPVFRAPPSEGRLLAFCKQLRGNFSIVIRRADATIAITDVAASVPIYRLDRSDAGASPLMSSRLADVRGFARPSLSREALFYWATHGGCGLRPLYEEIDEVAPASLAISRDDGRYMSCKYYDWDDIEKRDDVALGSAFDQFAEIATGYFRALNDRAGDARVACFLSGGTDSAVVALLAREAGLNVVGVTADYALRRYSELADASNAAARLGVPHWPVRVGRRDFRAAVEALRAPERDFPSGYCQATSIHAIGKRAYDDGIRMCLNGDFVGDLFLEFDDYTLGLPASGKDYAAAVAGLTLGDYIGRQRSPATARRSRLAVLTSLGVDLREMREWRAAEREAERRERISLFERYGYPLCDQIYALKHLGAKHRGLWSATRQAIGGDMIFANPFIDIAMIKFVLGLPLDFLYRDGVAKWFIREFLQMKTGLRQPKRYSPNPSRSWWLTPSLADTFGGRRELVGALSSLQMQNLLTFGRRYGDLAEVTALGHWLRGHGLSIASE